MKREFQEVCDKAAFVKVVDVEEGMRVMKMIEGKKKVGDLNVRWVSGSLNQFKEGRWLTLKLVAYFKE